MNPSSRRVNTPSPLAGEGRGEGAAVAATTARTTPSPPAPLPQGERGATHPHQPPDPLPQGEMGATKPLAPRGRGVGERGAVTQAAFVKHLRQHMTDSEIALWRHLRAHRLNGEKFRRQQPIGRYVVDFVHFGARLIVEADGGQHNSAAADEQRDTWLRAQGFTVMRFWNNEIMQNLAGVLETIMAAVGELSAQAAAPARAPALPPSPPPLSREGRGEQSNHMCSTPNAEAELTSHISPPPLAGEGLGRGEGVVAATTAQLTAKDSS